MAILKRLVMAKLEALQGQGFLARWLGQNNPIKLD